MRLVAYIRVSSNGQLDAYGPDVQRADIRRFAKANRHRIVAEFVDAITGKSDADDRPGLTAALEAVRRPPTADGIIVGNLSRLARQLHVQEAALAVVWREGGHVFAADSGEVLQDDPDDPVRTLIRQILGAVNQFDRATTVKRLKAGRQAKAAAGKHAEGQYRYGFAGAGSGRERDAAPLPAEQVAVARILALRAAGGSYRAIAAALDAEGLRPRRAASWSAMAVRSVVQRVGSS